MAKDKPNPETPDVEKSGGQTLEEITRDLLSAVTCSIDPLTGDVNCQVSDEQVGVIHGLPHKPRRVIFEVMREEEALK